MPRRKEQLQKGEKNTVVAMLLDETGSMSLCEDATISGFNEYKTSLAKNSENPVYMILTKFNSLKLDISELKPIGVFHDLNCENYKPDASTPLYDAIGQTIRHLEAVLSQQGEVSNVLFVVITDGEENSSHEFSKQAIIELIKQKERESNWTFVYLGANQDAWRVGQSIGVNAGNTMTFNQSNMSNVMKRISDATVMYSAAVASADDGQFRTTTFFQDAGQTARDYDDAGTSKPNPIKGEKLSSSWTRRPKRKIK